MRPPSGPHGVVAALLVFAGAGCGGRTTLDEPTEDASAAGHMDASAPDCAPQGVHVCGGACGPVAGCGGAACAPVLMGGDDASAFGICWGDLADQGTTPCALCDDGEGCVERAPLSFVCVPLPVCSALVALGATDACWYGDKLAFDGGAVAPATGCPDDPTDLLCGGDCPACPLATLARCVGRGPNHPFGICPATSSVVDRNEVSGVPLCTGDGTVACPVLPTYPYACAVFPNPPGDPRVAPWTGFCLSADLCATLSTSLPGGLWCYDASGTRTAP